MKPNAHDTVVVTVSAVFTQTKVIKTKIILILRATFITNFFNPLNGYKLRLRYREKENKTIASLALTHSNL